MFKCGLLSRDAPNCILLRYLGIDITITIGGTHLIPLRFTLLGVLIN